MHDIDPQTFCVQPYLELRINSDGSLNFCHAARKQNFGKIDNIHHTQLDNYFNSSPTIINVRQQIQTGQQTTQCENCYKNESQGIISFRQRHNLRYNIFPGLDFSQSAQESNVWKHIKQKKLKPKFYHISFGNLCNMACLMCCADNSSLFASLGKKIGLVAKQQPIKLDWTVEPAWSEFCNHIVTNEQIICLHVMGGEPMYHKRFRELLEFLVQQKHTNFHFTFVTNGSIYNQELIALLGQFKSVTIEISIETVDASNDYIRRHGNTSQVLANIKQWCNHICDTFNVVLRTVPQALSAPHYINLLYFARDHHLLIDSNVLQYPSFLKVNVLPEYLRTNIKKRLQQEFLSTEYTNSAHAINLRNQNNLDTNLQKNAQDLIVMLDEPCVDIEQERQLFVDHCVKFDRIGQQNIKDYIYDLWAFMQNYGYEKKLFDH